MTTCCIRVPVYYFFDLLVAPLDQLLDYWLSYYFYKSHCRKHVRSVRLLPRFLVSHSCTQPKAHPGNALMPTWKERKVQ